MLDPIQLGESQGFHHGTYREERWDWPSRGYTPAGTEVWNAMRALDYLETRPDVDADRMGVTGLSGGGVISWCLGAADERVKVVVPVCQSGSIEHVVTDRATDGHCDCAFWINYYRWCWPDIGALIAPRSLLIASGSEDILWRPYGYRDVAHRIRHQYAALGAGSHFDLVEDLTPHGYTPKLRRAIFTWFNTHLKNDPTPVTDDVTDFVEPEENLLVFGGKLPEQDEMRRIDKLLVQRADLPTITDEAAWRAHQETAIKRLRELTFRYTCPDRVPRQRDFRSDGSDKSGTFATYVFDSFDGMTISIKTKRPPESPVAHPHAGLRGATGRAQHLRGWRFFPARHPRRVRDRGRRGAQHGGHVGRPRLSVDGAANLSAAGRNTPRASGQRFAGRRRAAEAGARDGTGGRVRPGLHGAAGHLCRAARPADHRDRARRSPHQPRGPANAGVSGRAAHRRPASQPGAGLSAHDYVCGQDAGSVHVDAATLREAGRRRPHSGHWQHAGLAHLSSLSAVHDCRDEMSTMPWRRKQHQREPTGFFPSAARQWPLHSYGPRSNSSVRLESSDRS